jgi:hypothetical protein
MFRRRANVAAMKIPFTLGAVGHFGLAVRDPKKSAKWFGILCAVAEFERGVIAERVNAGLSAARLRGVKLGRSSTLGRDMKSRCGVTG